MENPIIILACPRSGSSMTAGLFAQHGVWVGICRGGNENNPKGYFENTLIKKQIKTLFGIELLRDAPILPDPAFMPEVYRIRDSQNYTGGPWLVKHSALYWRIWDKAKFVCVRRPVASVVQSNIDIGLYRDKWNREQLTTIMENHNTEMDYVVRHHGGRNVYTDDIVRGDYLSLKDAMEYCGIEMDFSIVRSFVEPKYWTH